MKRKGMQLAPLDGAAGAIISGLLERLEAHDPTGLTALQESMRLNSDMMACIRSLIGDRPHPPAVAMPRLRLVRRVAA